MVLYRVLGAAGALSLVLNFLGVRPAWARNVDYSQAEGCHSNFQNAEAGMRSRNLTDTKTAENVPGGPVRPCSTNDQQTLAMQNRTMREYAARRGWTITMQVREVGSGAVQREVREKLLEAARRREIDLVLVWRLDRW
ncbi:MAG: recombinase family protein, partial [Bryobacteraceae bacterium]